MQETWVQSLGREDPLEKEMATHSNILVWEIPWTEEPGAIQPVGSKSRHNLETNTFTFLSNWRALSQKVEILKYLEPNV